MHMLNYICVGTPIALNMLLKKCCFFSIKNYLKINSSTFRQRIHHYSIEKGHKRYSLSLSAGKTFYIGGLRKVNQI